MKKLFIIGLGLTVSSLAFQAKAQTSQAAANDKMKFGIRAGANLMKMGKFQFADQYYSTDSKVGFQAGIYADLPMGGGFAFLPEISYVQKGAKLEATVAGNTGTFDATVSYLDIPVLIGYKATPELTVFAGPQVSFLLAQKSTIKANNDPQTETTSTENFSKSLAGGAIGLGYSITPNININGRYSMDFQKALKDNVNQDKIKNSGFALSLGYTF
ncbi:porin family protein [Pedobacter frigoris]|uniref:PorT family protein n=1 Tax=Pedobacter frigoris TaxID=2571272 RepID=A0A4U1CGT3_9SPHI|nr:porin family protein [Pedobacter frigoris]TKC05072.1 PorT family protein [Pedobacter frigoris]